MYFFLLIEQNFKLSPSIYLGNAMKEGRHFSDMKIFQMINIKTKWSLVSSCSKVELQEGYEKYPLEKLIQNQQERLGNNETYFLNFQSPLLTYQRYRSTKQWFDVNNYGEQAGLRLFSSFAGLMAPKSHHKSFQSKDFLFLSF